MRDPGIIAQSSAIRGNVGSLSRMAELLCAGDRLRADPRFACAILGLLRKARIRGLRGKILLGMVRIRTLRITYYVTT